ncbi:ABC transporter permease [Rhizobium sp. NTR19]|uniref:ABC transporter permease n=1 Tax=Neorhizobium turbinariae TaxID=2937795 RepID=A0ABT0IKW5_9HYPH|nr:ABC transporter permease [Neorhizobium turbinariae]MCK8778520.1 ABC transporter permease [Neorhizobium turbinariae]
MRFRFDKLGIVIAVLAIYGLLASPFAVLKPNRILQGQAKTVLEALPPLAGGVLVAGLALAIVIALVRAPATLRLIAAVSALTGLVLAMGQAAGFLTPDGNTYARVSPASGFWILLFAFALLTADAITRLQPPPWLRVLLLGAAAVAIGLLFVSGSWNGLSIMKEYAGRADVFWSEAGNHVKLALGSLVAASIVGLPLGVLCHRVRWLRASVLNLLNLIQTIPSIALFGILIAPLAWIAANVPGASEAGIRGIGTAPAFVALFLYSLLPIVANTVVGLSGVPRETNEAARGIGMTNRQRLFQVEIPLALPVILTAIRIVLVQNIGMATIAALIGGGGFGVFVFQGIGQTAMDLVLLGAVPTVALAFAAAVVLDALIEMNSRVAKGGRAA